MNYELKQRDTLDDSIKITASSLVPLLKGEYKNLIANLFVIAASSSLLIAAPLILGRVIDSITQDPDAGNIVRYTLILLIVYFFTAILNYLQTMMAGGMGQRILFRLRSQIFAKLSSFPIAFFNVNKSGDLISRINNDTSKLDQFFSEGFVRLVGSIFTIAGIGVFVVILNWRLGLVTLSSAFVLFAVTKMITPWIRNRNRKSLEATGDFAADIQENINNYKVLVVFNRNDYFREKMRQSIQNTYTASLRAGIANTISVPLYDLATKSSYLLILVYGIYLIGQGDITIGLLVAFIAYANSFYSPLQEVASVYAMVQSGLAAWVRIQDIFSIKSGRERHAAETQVRSEHILSFQNVSFGYNPEQITLKGVSFDFEKGKTYALVGPTGGGKSTTASLMARLYDPTEGVIYLQGKDIRGFTDEELTDILGFILQEPYIFSGTLYENLVYGNKRYDKDSREKVVTYLKEKNLYTFIQRFPNGLETVLSPTDENISLGQKQVLAFVRALLREPQILILDEATANIDTLTEEVLEQIIDHMPPETTKVIIAHRLNTIRSADEIIFINGGKVQKSGSYEETLSLIRESKRVS